MSDSKPGEQTGVVRPLPSPKNPFPVIDAAGIFAPLPPLKYIVQALDLCPGAPAMFAGYGYSKKTLAAQALQLAIAANLGKIWGAFTAPGGRVLHIDYEQGRRLSSERYQRLAVPHMVGPADLQLDLVTMPDMYLDDSKAEAALERLVEGRQLVLIDSLRAAAPNTEENSSDARRPLDMLTRVSERSGAAFLVIHHARKPSATQSGGAKMAVRGSGALFDACASVLVFDGEKGRPTRVTHEKARSSGILTDDFELEVTDVPDGANPRAGLLVTAKATLSKTLSQAVSDDERQQAKRVARLDKVQQELEQLFAQSPELGGADEIASRLKRSAPDVRGLLKVMAADGKVQVLGTTSDRRHRWVG